MFIYGGKLFLPALPSTLIFSWRNFSKDAISMILSSTGLEQSMTKTCDFFLALGPVGFFPTVTILPAEQVGRDACQLSSHRTNVPVQSELLCHSQPATKKGGPKPSHPARSLVFMNVTQLQRGLVSFERHGQMTSKRRGFEATRMTLNPGSKNREGSSGC